jgi:hypothetical protein
MMSTPDEFLDAIFEAFRSHSSPTVDMGDSHGARGQGGMFILKSSYPFIRRAITDALVEVGLRLLAEEVIEEAREEARESGIAT